jgi:hypothetical protein
MAVAELGSVYSRVVRMSLLLGAVGRALRVVAPTLLRERSVPITVWFGRER